MNLEYSTFHNPVELVLNLSKYENSLTLRGL